MTCTRSWAALTLLVAPALLLLALHDRAHLLPLPTGAKPMFPIEAKLLLVDQPEVGGTARLLATVTAWAPGETVVWTLDLPDGVDLVSGERSWSGTLARGESRSFDLLVTVPDGARRDVTARAALPERPRATSAAAIAIDAGEPEGNRATEALVQGDGAEYLQYQGVALPRDGDK